MCLRVNKRIFASGFAMQAIIFLTASNIDRIIKVVNGKDGQPIEETQLTSLKKSKIPSNDDFLLDNVTGDLFSYNLYHNKWDVYGTCGLHKYIRTAENYERGRYVLNIKKFKIKMMTTFQKFHKYDRADE